MNRVRFFRFAAPLAFLICLLSATRVSAQLDNRFISDEITLNDSGTYGIALQANSYMRNTEYFNNVELGRTFFGYQLNPALYVQSRPGFKIQGGVYIRSDYGSRPAITRVLPTFTLRLGSGANTYTFGTLEGALAHRLIEPMMDINAGIERRIENGFQFRRTTEKQFTDVWINWERFIERGSPYKEQFAAGINFTPVLWNRNPNFSVSLPLQFLAFHRGGQIDRDTGKVVMFFTGTAGVTCSRLTENRFIRKIEGGLHVVANRENTNSGYFPFRQGSGQYATVAVSTKSLCVMFNYWHGERYISPRGTPIYQSVSVDKPLYTESQRSLLFLRFLYQQELYPGLAICIRYEPFLDLLNKQFDYSYSVYLTYRERFALGNTRRNSGK